MTTIRQHRALRSALVRQAERELDKPCRGDMCVLAGAVLIFVILFGVGT